MDAPPAVSGCELPAQMLADEGATVTEGEGLTEMASVRGALMPQLLLAVTEIFPEVEPNVTETDVPEPEIVAPAGAVQV